MLSKQQFNPSKCLLSIICLIERSPWKVLAVCPQAVQTSQVSSQRHAQHGNWIHRKHVILEIKTKTAIPVSHFHFPLHLLSPVQWTRQHSHCRHYSDSWTQEWFPCKLWCMRVSFGQWVKSANTFAALGFSCRHPKT